MIMHNTNELKHSVWNS